jgi:hypothetical protein
LESASPVTGPRPTTLTPISASHDPRRASFIHPTASVSVPRESAQLTLEVAMVGGGSFGWEPGDTSMAIAIAEVGCRALPQLERLSAIWMPDG